jgi:hypothetical protein
VTNAAVATKIHQTFDVHRDFATQITLDLKICYRRSKFCNLGFGKVLCRRRRINSGCGANLLRPRITNTVDRRQRNYDVLVKRYVYACYTCHSISSFWALLRFWRPSQLTLALLVPRVGTNHPHNTVATNDLAVPADFLNRCSYFHEITPAR